MKALRTLITDDNEGMDSPTNYRKAMTMLTTHPYELGILYHIVLTGSESKADYRWAVDKLCRELRRKGMPCMWKACYEVDSKKRFHMHIFLLIEARHHHPDSIIHFKEGNWFVSMLAKKKIGFKIAEPKDKMHMVAGKRVNYAYVPKKASPKLDDVLVWISYLYKVRSKADVIGQKYTSSTNRPSNAAINDLYQRNK